jgi:tetratricopeptide (TPR) repeat protein
MDDNPLNEPTQNRHRQWAANPSEQWAFALDHVDAGEWDKAIMHCQRALEIWPTFYDALLLLSSAYEAKGNLDSALNTAQQAADTAIHELSQAWNNLASLHIRRKEYEQAITIDRVLSLIDPSRLPLCSYRMAIAFTSLGDIENGEHWLRKAIERRKDLYERALNDPALKVHADWLRQESRRYRERTLG